MMHFSLHKACEENWVDCVRMLLDNGADVNGRDIYKRTPLHCVCSVNVNFNNYLDSVDFSDSRNIRNKCKIVEMLLGKGANPNIFGQKSSGLTPLHVAAMSGQRELVQTMLKFNGNPNYRCSEGKTALHFSSKHGYEEISSMLIEAGCSINSVDYKGRTPLHDASTSLGCYYTIDMLINSHAIIDWKDYKQRTPLHCTIINKKYEMSVLLLEKGANVNSSDSNGFCPIHFSVNTGICDFVKLMLDFNANVNASNKDGNTALHLAVIQNNITIIKYLLKHSADPNLTNNNLETPLHLAIRQTGTREIVECLLEFNASITLVNVKGKCVLDMALQTQECVLNLLNIDSEIKKIIVHHAIKLKALNFINYKNYFFVNRYPDYYKDCLTQVNKIKKNNLFYILAGSVDSLARTLRNEEIKKKLLSIDYFLEIPIYGRMFEMKIANALRRKKLLVKSEECLLRLFTILENNLPRLPPECYPFILRNLTNRDLCSLNKLCNQL